MKSSSISGEIRRPIIGCTSFCKLVDNREVLGLNKTYVDAIVAAGGVPLLIPVGLSESDQRAIFNLVDGILLPGGGDVLPRFYTEERPHDTLRGLDENRDQLELFMAWISVKQSKPVLAVCRGHQVFNVALGGSLWQDISSQMPNANGHDHPNGLPRNHLLHKVNVLPGTKLSKYLTGDQVYVNSLHHQGIKELAKDLVATAFAPDGLIEAVELPGHPFAIGVQWHPEDLIHDDPQMLDLFKGLIEAASQ